MVFASIYEITDTITTVRKNRMWDWFDGTVNHSRWNENDISGSGITITMSTAIGEGINISSVTTGFGAMEFNNINQYAEDASVIHWITRKVEATCNQIWAGFDQNATGSIRQMAIIRNSSSTACHHLLTGDGDSCNATAMGVTDDEVFRVNTIETNACDVDAFLCGGCSCATNSTDIPTIPMQPMWLIDNLSASGTKNGRIRYVEAFNK